jgi:hypothetical protein
MISSDSWSCALSPWECLGDSNLSAIDKAISNWVCTESGPATDVVSSRDLTAQQVPAYNRGSSEEAVSRSLARVAAPSFQNTHLARADIGAASYESHDAAWDKALSRQELGSMTVFVNKLIDGNGIVVTKRQRHVRCRRSLLIYTTAGKSLSWGTQSLFHSTSLALLQLVEVHRSGCTIRLISSQRSWLGQPLSATLVLDNDEEAVMLELILLQLRASAANAAKVSRKQLTRA